MLLLLVDFCDVWWQFCAIFCDCLRQISVYVLFNVCWKVCIPNQNIQARNVGQSQPHCFCFISEGTFVVCGCRGSPDLLYGMKHASVTVNVLKTPKQTRKCNEAVNYTLNVALWGIIVITFNTTVPCEWNLEHGKVKTIQLHSWENSQTIIMKDILLYMSLDMRVLSMNILISVQYFVCVFILSSIRPVQLFNL